VTPADEELVETAVGLVHAVLCRVDRVGEVRVGGERVGVDDLLGRDLAPDDKGVADDVLREESAHDTTMRGGAVGAARRRRHVA
jgi:hypothetical protein